MEHTHHSERCMNGSSFNHEMIVMANVIEKCRVRWPADRWNMQFHFNAAETREIIGDYRIGGATAAGVKPP